MRAMIRAILVVVAVLSVCVRKTREHFQTIFSFHLICFSITLKRPVVGSVSCWGRGARDTRAYGIPHEDTDSDAGEVPMTHDRIVRRLGFNINWLPLEANDTQHDQLLGRGRENTRHLVPQALPPILIFTPSRWPSIFFSGDTVMFNPYTCGGLEWPVKFDALESWSEIDATQSHEKVNFPLFLLGVEHACLRLCFSLSSNALRFPSYEREGGGI